MHKILFALMKEERFRVAMLGVREHGKGPNFAGNGLHSYSLKLAQPISLLGNASAPNLSQYRVARVIDTDEAF